MSRSYHETFALLKGKTKAEVNDFFLNEYEGKSLCVKSIIKKQIKKLRKELKEYDKRFSYI